MIKVLLDARAQQTCRDNVGNNIIHSILSNNASREDEDLELFRSLLSLIDTRILASLFIERSTAEPGAATLLARWVRMFLESNRMYYNINNNSIDRQALEKPLRIILEFSKGDDLSIVNSEGDTPVHAATRYSADALVRIILECRPELLFRENATGHTPHEVAEDAYLSKQIFNDPPFIHLQNGPYFPHGRRRLSVRSRNTTGVLDRRPEIFVEEPEDNRSETEKVWDVCKEIAQETPATKRKLVSLVEASEVAERLARKKGTRDQAEEQKAQGGEEIKGDDVDVWFQMVLRVE
ncbi:hypothetical protein BDU57DRAFT_509210 [Ampelomyces quisqualis]|uniref:Uncharacterized protein n=1 Tax=Ampelomyces quisqualis TaxID=50730 RepID=A0A6A5QY97_AMPQU|nr:hypothetical protein BDU57DRAFT_509210 [Ampelomyces quisqualis]